MTMCAFGMTGCGLQEDEPRALPPPADDAGHPDRLLRLVAAVGARSGGDRGGDPAAAAGRVMTPFRPYGPPSPADGGRNERSCLPPSAGEGGAQRRKGVFSFILALCLLTLPALAVEPSEMLNDPALEARARE